MARRVSAGGGGRGAGVDRATEAFWRGHVTAWARTRLSVRTYCRRHDLTEACFVAFRDRMDGLAPQRPVRSAAVSRPSPLFAEVRVAAGAEACPIAVALPGGAEVRVRSGFDADTLIRVLDALERRGC